MVEIFLTIWHFGTWWSYPLSYSDLILLIIYYKKHWSCDSVKKGKFNNYATEAKILCFKNYVSYSSPHATHPPFLVIALVFQTPSLQLSVNVNLQVKFKIFLMTSPKRGYSDWLVWQFVLAMVRQNHSQWVPRDCRAVTVNKQDVYFLLTASESHFPQQHRLTARNHIFSLAIELRGLQ